ncbi:acyl transferase/acyl hydrolase/lysophospholipase [Collybia nuda]|uniref:Acyl transferase/acyl hydrolase/lysophospholipase n=1 Tax=Collybia nuda TaxID=64659 RepID=A0A9P5YDE3_9AGAR|nr:acyl transferase/acyl hydrolase/lysophospholipase [Collybia nuda]
MILSCNINFPYQPTYIAGTRSPSCTKTMAKKVSKVRKYILSVDGGGFRGLSCLIILSHIMRMLVEDPDEEIIPSPCQAFDLICGTSTGGLIALLLGRLGLNCSTAISVYKELGPSVFGRDEGTIWGNIVKGERFPSAAFEALLAEVVTKYTGSGETLLKAPKSSPDALEHGSTDTFVTVVSTDAGSAGVEAYRLRSYPTPRKGTDSAPIGHNWTICQAARATSAAPTYFSPLEVGSQLFQDAGASGFNNPVMEAVQEAEMRWPPSKHEYVIISLGTGLASLISDDIENTPLRDGTPDSKIRKVVDELRRKVHNVVTVKDRLEHVAKQLVRVATDSELAHSRASGYFARRRPDDYFRFNPPQGLGDLNLADYMSEGLIVEITNVWLRTPDGKESSFSAYEKIQESYEEKKSGI